MGFIAFNSSQALAFWCELFDHFCADSIEIEFFLIFLMIFSSRCGVTALIFSKETFSTLNKN